MNFDVILTQDAMCDLKEIYSYIKEQKFATQTDSFRLALKDKIEGLKTFPDGGTYPRELLDLGMKEYREVYVYSIRMIYRIIDTNVNIYVVADGRRDFRSLLERRLLHN